MALYYRLKNSENQEKNEVKRNMADKKYNQPTKVTNKDFLHTIAGLIGLGLSALSGVIQPNRQANIISPLAENQMVGTYITPTPTPTPVQPLYGRNPKFQTFVQQNPSGYQEVLSAVNAAVPDNNLLLKQLMLDLALGESRLNPKAVNKKSGATGAWQFMPGTAKFAGLSPEDRTSATESAKAVRKLLEQGYLKWWDTYKRSGGATPFTMSDLYSPEELSKFLK
jgi:hypothetical protein